MSNTLLPPDPTTTILVSSTTRDPLFTLPEETPDPLKKTDAPFNFPFWGYIIIAVGVIGVVGVIIFAAKRAKTKHLKQEKIAEYRTKEDKRFAAVAAELGEMYTATDHAKIEKESQYYKKKGQTQIKRTG